MRATLPSAVLVVGLLAFAGAASASDYMLPLLQPKAPAQSSSAVGPAAPAQPEAGGASLVSPSPVAIGVALAGATIVVAGFVAVLRRAEP
jgi:hypothetical protein